MHHPLGRARTAVRAHRMQRWRRSRPEDLPRLTRRTTRDASGSARTRAMARPPETRQPRPGRWYQRCCHRGRRHRRRCHPHRHRYCSRSRCRLRCYPLCRFRLQSLRTPRGCMGEAACYSLACPVSTAAAPRRRAVLPAAAGRDRPCVLCQWPNHARGSGDSGGGCLRGCADVDWGGRPPPPAPPVVPRRPPRLETRRRRSQLRETRAPAP